MITKNVSMTQHPLMLELQTICKKFDINEGKASLAFELYVELCEVHKLWQVDYHFNENLKIFYFTAKLKKNQHHDIYVPLNTDEVLSPEYIERLHSNLASETKTIVLVFKDRDSSSTYYRITEGLVQPDSPQTAQKRKNEEKMESQFQKELVRNRKKLFANLIKNERTASQ